MQTTFKHYYMAPTTRCLARWHISIFLWIDLMYSSAKDLVERERQTLQGDWMNPQLLSWHYYCYCHNDGKKK